LLPLLIGLFGDASERFAVALYVHELPFFGLPEYPLRLV
jgi:hypothetical protein